MFCSPDSRKTPIMMMKYRMVSLLSFACCSVPVQYLISVRMM